MADAHDPGYTGFYSSPDVRVEIRSGEGSLYSRACAGSPRVAGPPVAPHSGANNRHRLSGRAYTDITKYSGIRLPGNVTVEHSSYRNLMKPRYEYLQKQGKDVRC